jgi:hypothetical protein
MRAESARLSLTLSAYVSLRLREEIKPPRVAKPEKVKVTPYRPVVGERVNELIHGFGTVVKLSNTAMLVDFDRHGTVSYRLGDRRIEAAPDAPPVPVRAPLPGDPPSVTAARAALAQGQCNSDTQP